MNVLYLPIYGLISKCEYLCCRQLIVYGERESRVHGIKICGGIYQRVRYGQGIIIRFAASPKPATGPKYDVIKMAALFAFLME